MHDRQPEFPVLLSNTFRKSCFRDNAGVLPRRCQRLRKHALYARKAERLRLARVGDRCVRPSQWGGLRLASRLLAVLKRT